MPAISRVVHTLAGHIVLRAALIGDRFREPAAGISFDLSMQK
jgi:hypothetical protein